MSSRSKAFDTALAVVQADIIAEKLAGHIKPVIVEKEIVVEKPAAALIYPTEYVNLENETINGQSQILNEDGKGRVEKILIRSPNQNFNISLQADYGQPLQESYTDFQDVAAWQDGSTYVMELTDIAFEKNIRFSITTTQATTFSRIFIKYHIKRKD
jgi:hypothetical protein